MKEAIKYWLRNFKRYNEFGYNMKKLGVKDDIPLGENVITNKTDTMGDMIKKFGIVHNKFKFAMVVPLILLAKWKLRKTMIKTVGPEPQYKFMRIFNKAYHQSMEELQVVDHKYVGRKNLSQAELEHELETKNTFKMLRDMLHIFQTLVIYDTYYKVFFEILIKNVTLNTQTEFSKDNKHVLYTSKSINDVNFFTVAGRNSDNIVLDAGDHLVAVKKGDAIRIEKVQLEPKVTKQ